MSRSAQDILASWLDELFPAGAAWARDPSSNLGLLMMALAVMRAQLEEDMEALYQEICPGTSTLLLGEYQKALGADPYGRDIGSLSVAQTQALLQSRWIGRSGQSIAYYESLGASVGCDLSILEPDPAIWGQFVYGDDTVFSDPRIDLYTWVVVLPRPGTGLEAIIRANRQPDTNVLFGYAGTTGFGFYDFAHIPFGG